MRRPVHCGFIAFGQLGPMRSIFALALALALGLLAAAAQAAAEAPPAAPAPATVLSLSPEEKVAVLQAAAEHRRLVIEPLGVDAVGVPDRRVHGSASVYVGSNGGYGLSSTTVVPLGQTGVAAVSVATENVPRRAR